jgi:hypothetical protein
MQVRYGGTQCPELVHCVLYMVGRQAGPGNRISQGFVASDWSACGGVGENRVFTHSL